jgi:hypothetical protein
VIWRAARRGRGGPRHLCGAAAEARHIEHLRTRRASVPDRDAVGDPARLGPATTTCGYVGASTSPYHGGTSPYHGGTSPYHGGTSPYHGGTFPYHGAVPALVHDQTPGPRLV